MRILEESNVSLFTGGGGTGKTTTLAEWLKQDQDQVTYCFAPTGKAARRMEEAFVEAGVPLRAQTIHSGLIPARIGHDGNGWSFVYNEKDPLPADRVIVDETSMLDASIFHSLLKAIRPGTKLILVGDTEQLPPVGKGRPFLDMINSKAFPHANLTEVHRYAGRIAHVCKAIREGRTFKPSETLDMDPEAGEYGPENYRHIERRRSSDVLRTLDAVIEKVRDRGFDPWREMQVLVTRNTQGELSRVSVNERLQNLLNPGAMTIKNCPFRLGDKVVCKKNGQRAECEFDGVKYTSNGMKSYVSNGEDGVIVELEEKYAVVDFGGSYLKFSRGVFGTEIVLGYAITCHSSQGSGWPVVINLIDDCRISDKNLVYTAMSRPKKMLFTIGRLETIYKQIRSSNLSTRKTFLKERLQEAA